MKPCPFCGSKRRAYMPPEPADPEIKYSETPEYWSCADCERDEIGETLSEKKAHADEASSERLRGN